MNLYIVGNGFDLELGCDTSYKSFLDSIEFKLLCDKGSSNQIAKHIEDVYKKEIPSLWVDLEIALGKYANEFGKEGENEFIESLDGLKLRLKSYLLRQMSKYTNKESRRADSFLNLIADDLSKKRNVML